MRQGTVSIVFDAGWEFSAGRRCHWVVLWKARRQRLRIVLERAVNGLLLRDLPLPGRGGRVPFGALEATPHGSTLIMATLKPFRALRPDPAKAAEICAPPYDVMSTEEARQMAEGNPLSFLRVTRAELELDDSADPHSAEVYARGAANLRKLVDEGHLVREEKPCYYLYRLVMGDHAQFGVVAVASCEEYDRGIVKKHELTRPDKEDDRTRHIEILGAQTGSVFLTYRAEPTVDGLLAELAQRPPDIDFTASDGVRHELWIVSHDSDIERLRAAFDNVPALYIADGHHRSAAASRVAAERSAKNPGHNGDEPYNYFLTVTFPHNQVKILGYNRAVQDLNGLSAEDFKSRLAEVATLEPAGASPDPTRKGELTMYLGGEWMRLAWKPEVVERAGGTVERLDVAILQDRVLGPMLGIGDPRLDKRISFVGGIRGTGELERLVDSGRFAVAFALYPTALEDLMTISDEGGLMPPKSTWFEPKLRDALAVHLIG